MSQHWCGVSPPSEVLFSDTVFYLIIYSGKHGVIVKNIKILLILPLLCFPIISSSSVHTVTALIQDFGS